ncbi:Gryzun, putative trafficking through golgi-domain-containing protein [Phellopilus nigrolimitatus]|nr:Gryzun, putative trafficking through golgi-domain-containing protein [Phellopilus nigrolimitatus]
MNSYPAELLVQLAPVMFVAGLETSRTQPSSTVASVERDSSNDVMPTTPTTPSTPMTPATPIAPKARRTTSTDQFALLTHRLREVLAVQRKPGIWIPEAVRKSKTFQVVFVDKAVQFPPRKLPDPTSAQQLRSPLSPLMPTSPLHPDGIVAPIWIRKHSTLVPSVFVLFMRLYEHVGTGPISVPRSPLEPDGPDVQRAREEREKEERAKDSELAQEIAERKKSTNEREMKLTVVLLASRRMLDDPALDTRLTFIRRASGLDARAALFVLSPVSPAELTEFVKSLQQALYDPALEYYTAHAKRVRRKRNRHTQGTSGPALFPLGIANAPARPLPLRPEGWTVRYEYKMACFAEFRGEDEVALKHYQDAYTTLMTMFGSPAILPPRTKRWAEAKVLADTINVKICKLFLYNAEHALALSQLNVHLRRFSDLSARVWGIGEDTFEYWSWLARQHRVFAELLEQGTHFSLTIPVHLPAPSAASSSTQPQQDIEALRELGMNPSTALMHPGFYYYIAAGCTEKRRLRFLALLGSEVVPQSGAQAPGFQNEKKVDHLASILELYTKSYELFKKYSAAPASAQNQMQGRFTLWIAYRIAQTYYESGKYDMAVRFFERIARTYSREKWGAVLRPLLSTWYSCAQKLGDVEMSVRLLAEMLARGHSPQNDEGPVAEDLHAVLKSTVPSSSETIVVDLTESEPLFNSSVVFWAPEIKLDEQVAFQISLAMPADVNLCGLPISTLRLYYLDDFVPIVLRHVASEKDQGLAVQRIDVGHVSLSTENDVERQVDASLRWQRDGTLVIAGTMSSDTPRELKFTKAVLSISEGSWNIDLPFNLGRRRTATVSSPKWLTSTQPVQFIPIRRSNASSAVVKHRPHEVHVAFSHRPPAYLDESYPISIDVTNDDDRELEFSLDVLLQPGDDDSLNYILIEDEQSSGLIKGISYGVLHPGTTACKTLHLVSTSSAGERMLDVSIQSRTVLPGHPEASPTNEVLQTLVIPVVAPFKVKHETSYTHRSSIDPGQADLTTFDADYWDDSVGGRAFVVTIFECVDCAGASSVSIESVKLNAKGSAFSKIVHCSLDEEEFQCEFMPGDQFSVVCELSLAPPEDFFTDKDAVLDKTGHFLLAWRRLSPSGDPGIVSTTQIALPALKPPLDGLVALLNVPPIAHLHQPFPLELVIRNFHPTRTACPMISLDLDPSDSFIVAGVRNGRLPTLIPGAEEKVIWRLIPLDCGPVVRLPKMRVTDRRKVAEAADTASGIAPEVSAVEDEVRVVDVRWDRRRPDGSDALQAKQEMPEGDNSRQRAADRRFTIAVSPV